MGESLGLLVYLFFACVLNDDDREKRSGEALLKKFGILKPFPKGLSRRRQILLIKKRKAHPIRF